MATIFQKISRATLPLLAVLFLFSCQKDLNDDINQGGGYIPDLTTKVTATTVSGFVTDENNDAVTGASVTVGGSITSTDEYGYFEVKDVLVVKEAAVVTVNNPGYFKGIKTFIAEQGKSAFFRIKLIPKTNSGSIDATAGGNVTLGTGLIVALPSNAVVNASSNAPYSGSVKVAAYWIDPTAATLSAIMPGDLRGINTGGAIKLLTTYGMAAVELTGDGGELLQIAPGKKATLTFPLPGAISGSAPASIPLWAFDEAKGVWVEEGQATKTGNTYVGEVSHFSFWNCDVPNNYVQVNFYVKDSDGHLLMGARVKISIVGSPYNAGYGITDPSGYVSGPIPANAQLLLEIFAGYNCGAAVYSQTFSSTNSDITLGIITLPPTTGTANISGTVTDCLNNPVTNGYIVMLNNGAYERQNLSNTGTYNFSTFLCSSTANVSFIAEDAGSAQQSAIHNQTISSGANTIPNLQACGVSIQQFITYTVDGGAPVNYVWPTDSLTQTGSGTTSMYMISGTSYVAPNTNSVYFSFPTVGIASGSAQPLESFFGTAVGTQTIIPNPINVNITEFGAVGEFIAGNFTGIVSGSGLPAVNYNIVCSFRVRRNF